MIRLTGKDLPTGLSHLRTYWEGEEADPEIIEKFCDGEITEDEEIRMFLEWCQEEGIHDMLEEDKRDLKELLAKMN